MTVEQRSVDAGVCPECGLARSVRGVAAPWWVRQRRAIQVAALAAALSWVGWKNWPRGTDWFTQSFAGGMATVDFPKTRLTREDLEAYASGARQDGTLAEMVLPEGDGFGNVEMTAAFVAPSGQRTDFRRIGWPVEWLVYRWDADYADVYEGKGVTAKLPTRATGWYGWTHIRYRIDSVGRREARLFYPTAFAGTVLVLIGAWHVGRMARWGAWQLGLTAAGGRWRDRFARRMPVVCIATAMGLMAVMSIRAPVKPSMLLPMPWMPPTGTTGLKSVDIAAMRGEAGADARLARALLDAAAGVPAAGDVLLIGWKHPWGSRMEIWRNRWPPGMVEFGTTVQRAYKPGGRGEWGVSADTGWVGVRLYRRGPVEAEWHVSVGLSWLGVLALGLWTAWAAAGLAAMAVYWWKVARARTRARAGRCVGCGYELAGLGSAE